MVYPCSLCDSVSSSLCEALMRVQTKTHVHQLSSKGLFHMFCSFLQVHGKDYVSEKSIDLYITTGTASDWYATVHIAWHYFAVDCDQLCYIPPFLWVAGPGTAT